MRQGSPGAKAKRTLESMRVAAPACVFNNAKILSRSLEKIYDDAFRPAGLSASQVALLWTILVTEPVSLKDVAGFLRADQTTVSRIVARARALGLVVFSRSDSDQRQKVIRLSILGRDRLAEIFPLWKKAQLAVKSIFDPEPLRGLVRRLRADRPSTLKTRRRGPKAISPRARPLSKAVTARGDPRAHR